MYHSVSEIKSGERFAFGKNWTSFLNTLNDARILIAEDSLKKMLDITDLNGKRILDIGSGSGLFSLAARRLGAEVHSFDYDPDSVACTRELKRRYFPDDPLWVVEEGSVLDKNYLTSLGKFDVVYSWGVLHHTGSMWEALANTTQLVASNGKLFISIYNNQGLQSRFWYFVKHTYNRMPRLFRPIFACLVMLPREFAFFALSTIKGRPAAYVDNIANYSKKSSRGMSYYHDLVDWVGGYPFEVAKPDEIFDFFWQRGFTLRKLKTCGGNLGCNEFVFLYIKRP
jgi:SAM-dependent methyltransferase